MHGADDLDDDAIRRLLLDTRRIAMVGASNKPERPSNGVLAMLVRHGYEVIPVNPGLAGQAIHGRTVVATLEDAAPLDMVDLFRSLDQIEPAMDDAIRLGARSIWMQLGLVHERAAAKARAAGLVVVMDRCPKIEISRLGIPPARSGGA
ncbi:CoA-binding protein [Acetobacteraceae bacterium KSS8]|uniref:CoA-binding protein n=1 Tax=Endosaccharibacter trunci TaxID=2812733 RepID=A0ABT1W7W7_9PROT|nr:CoA-binding protein [Acetobacteraceae bacterium KSS8]